MSKKLERDMPACEDMCCVVQRTGRDALGALTQFGATGLREADLEKWGGLVCWGCGKDRTSLTVAQLEQVFEIRR